MSNDVIFGLALLGLVVVQLFLGTRARTAQQRLDGLLNRGADETGMQRRRRELFVIRVSVFALYLTFYGIALWRGYGSDWDTTAYVPLGLSFGVLIAGCLWQGWTVLGWAGDDKDARGHAWHFMTYNTAYGLTVLGLISYLSVHVLN